MYFIFSFVFVFCAMSSRNNSARLKELFRYQLLSLAEKSEWKFTVYEFLLSLFASDSFNLFFFLRIIKPEKLSSSNWCAVRFRLRNFYVEENLWRNSGGLKNRESGNKFRERKERNPLFYSHVFNANFSVSNSRGKSWTKHKHGKILEKAKHNRHKILVFLSHSKRVEFAPGESTV